MPSNQFGQDLEEDLGYDLFDDYEPPEDDEEVIDVEEVEDEWTDD